MICSRFTETLPCSRVVRKVKSLQNRAYKAMRGHQHLGNVYNVPHVPVTGKVIAFQKEHCQIHLYCPPGVGTIAYD